MEKLYFIVDMTGNYYKLNKRNNLILAKGSEEADMFSLKEANERIGSGKKSHFYTTLEAEVKDAKGEVPANESNRYDEIETPTLFDSLHNDWEDCISKLCYMSSHIQTYRENLNTMLSVTDQEICDIEHYIELNNPNDVQMLKAAKLLQDKRRRRREIKDEMDRIELLKSTFLDEEFKIKVHQSMEYLQKMKCRKYTPRKLTELFDAIEYAS